MPTIAMDRSHDLQFGLLALCAILGLAGCFTSPDVKKIKCSSTSQCPTGYLCQNGKCATASGTGGSSQDAVAGNVPDVASDVSSIETRGLDSSGMDTALGPDLPAPGFDVGEPDAPLTSTGGAGGSPGRDGGSSTGGVGGSGGAVGSGGVVGSGGSSTGVDATGDQRQALAPGASCAGNSDCAAGTCLDAICCDKPCSGCNACKQTFTGKADGICAPVALGLNPHSTCVDETKASQCGNDGTCDGAGACHKVGTSHVCTPASCASGSFTPASTCDGLGACTTVKATDCGALQCNTTGCLKTCTSQADCDTTNYYCNTTTGQCATKNTNGTPAFQPYECLSGVVADGVCCDKTCTGCNACTNALTGRAAGTTGQCLPVLAGLAGHSMCTNSGATCGTDGKCDGNGGCSSTPATGASCGDLCTVGATCQAGVCKGGSPKTCAAPAECHGAGTCNTSTGNCDYPITANASCGAQDQCLNGTSTPGGKCNSAGTCVAGTGTQCSPYACNSGATACSQNCSPSCGNGAYCLGGFCYPQKIPGQGCGTSAECRSGTTCLDGVCCTSPSCPACKMCGTDGTCSLNKPSTTSCGLCKQCGSNGQCDAMPADDSGCGTITCPANTTCRTYSSSSITTNRCKSLGSCKAGADCPFTSAQKGNSCGASGAPIYCDGTGNCVTRTVRCGTSDCPLDTQFCCMLPDVPSQMCMTIGSACGTDATAESPNTGIPASCDENDDCPTGKACCLANPMGTYSVDCRFSNQCPGVGAFGPNYLLCHTPVMTQACPSGVCQTNSTVFPTSDWMACF
jgi:hypothetical protein